MFPKKSIPNKFSKNLEKIEIIKNNILLNIVPASFVNGLTFHNEILLFASCNLRIDDTCQCKFTQMYLYIIEHGLGKGV